MSRVSSDNNESIPNLQVNYDEFGKSSTSTLNKLNANKDDGSTFLKGRKASTYLRIFRDNESAASEKSDENEVKTDDDVLDRVKEEEDKNSNKKELRKNVGVSAQKLGTDDATGREKSFDSQDSFFRRLSHKLLLSKKSSTPDNAATSMEEDELPIHLEPETTKHTEIDTIGGIASKSLALTPISSATYYPHKSRENNGASTLVTPYLSNISHNRADFINIDQINNEDEIMNEIQSNNHSEIIPVGSIQQNSNGKSTIERSSSVQTISDQKSYFEDVQENENDKNGEKEEDDDDDDDSEYPLAVELQPFTNNVGGHTAIFRFSKRAVCKALVNRENKWYESIELKHSELLQFMPRYIGVLNVRQHFRSKEDFLQELTRTKQKKKEANYKQLQYLVCDDQMDVTNGVPIKPVKSNPVEDVTNDQGTDADDQAINKTFSNFEDIHSYEDGPLMPEVVLDDNKHIIPESLWFKYQRSPSISPRCSHAKLISAYNLSGNDEDKKDKNKLRCDSGSTSINTKLQELVLREVFAPTYTRKQKIEGDEFSKGKGSRMELPTSAERDLNTNTVNNDPNVQMSLDDSNVLHEKLNDPLLEKIVQKGLSNAVNASHSVMNLEQFHRKAMAKVSSDNPCSKEERQEEEHTGEVKQVPMLPKLSTTKSIQEPMLHLNDSNFNEKFTKRLDERLSTYRSSTSSANGYVNNDSVTFEEVSDTIVSKFILLEDLTRKMNKPCALDLKMGTRQYGVDASITKQLSQSKKCLRTTSRRLGARVCGLKIWNKDSYIRRDKYFGRRVKIGWQFTRVLARFLYNGSNISSILLKIPQLLSQLDILAVELNKLKGYRLYGASLLLMYDGNATKPQFKKSQVNLIDFARCVTKDDLDDGIESFKIPPKYPTSEDRGFIRGVKSLKFYLSVIWKYLTADEPVLYDDAELDKYLFKTNKERYDVNWDWLDEFDKEDEFEYNDPNSELRKKWRKYELIFDVEPRCIDNDEVSD